MSDPSESTPKVSERDADLEAFMRLAGEAAPKESVPGERFFAPLGRFMIEFNRFEQRLNWVLRALALTPSSDAGFLTLAHVQSTFDRIKLLHQLTRYRFPGTEMAKEASRLSGVAKRLNIYRNALVHGEWRSLGPGLSGTPTSVHVDLSAFVLYFDSSGDGTFHQHHPTPEQIQKKASELGQLSREIFTFSAQVARKNEQEYQARVRKRDEQSS